MGDKDQSAITQGISTAWRHARRSVILVFGSTVVLIGMALLVLPGPGTVVIPVGLGILATEFVWARRLLRRARDQGGQILGKLVGESNEPDETGKD